MSIHHSSTDAVPRRLCLAAAAVVGLSAVLALLGWSTNLPALTNLGQPVPMNPITAVAFALAAGSLLLMLPVQVCRSHLFIGRMMAIGVMAVGSLRLIGFRPG